MKAGDSVRVLSTPNHHNDLHRVYDMPEKYRWVGESIVPRSFVGKVPGRALGIILEVRDDQLKVLFHGGVIGWISPHFVEIVDPNTL